MSEFEYIDLGLEETEDHTIHMEIAYQLKRIADTLSKNE